MEKKAKLIPGLPEPKQNFEGIAARTMENGWTKFSHTIASTYGYKEAIILGILMNEYDRKDRYHQSPELVGFSISIGKFRNVTKMGKRTIYKTIDNLLNHGFLAYIPGEQGDPYSKRRYKLNEDLIKAAHNGDGEKKLKSLAQKFAKDLESKIRPESKIFWVTSSSYGAKCTNAFRSDLCQKSTIPMVQNEPCMAQKAPYPDSKGTMGMVPNGTNYIEEIEAHVEVEVEGKKGDFIDSGISFTTGGDESTQDGVEAVEVDTPAQEEAATAADDSVEGKTNRPNFKDLCVAAGVDLAQFIDEAPAPAAVAADQTDPPHCEQEIKNDGDHDDPESTDTWPSEERSDEEILALMKNVDRDIKGRSVPRTNREAQG